MRIPIGLAALLACTASYAATPAQTIPSSIFTAPQRLVAVDGARRLNLYCVGTGAPTVVFEAGAGGGMLDWRHVQGQISAFTQACAYDRAGHGWSDAANRPSDVANTADDLHRLLKAAGIATPVVYVAHSIAGLYAVYFTAKYPQDVAGAVLVDPSFAHQTAATLAGLDAASRAVMTKMNTDNIAQMHGCIGLARKGELAAPVTKAAKDCVDVSGYPDKLDDTLKHEETRESQSLSINEAISSEYDNFLADGSKQDTDDTELDSVRPDFGGKMLIVLTHGTAIPVPPGLDAKQLAPFEAAWIAGHDQLAHLSTRGSNTIIPNASHYIQYDRPQVVIDAVRRVVMDVRSHS